MKVARARRTPHAMRPMMMLSFGLLAGCFVSPNETILGRLDDGGTSGGSAGGNVAGGSTAGGEAGGSTAGGSSAGGAAGGSSGGAAGGAGPLTILLDAGVIPSAGAAPAICNTHGVLARELFSRIPADAGCGNGCLWDVASPGAALVFRSSLVPGESVWQDVATGPDFEVLTTTNSATNQRRLAAVPFAGGAPQTIEPLPSNSNVTVWGRWFQTTFAYTLSITNQTTGQTTHALKIWRPAESPPLLELATLPSYPRARPVAVSFAGRYALALDDGLYVAPMYTPGQAQRFYASNAIGAFVATDTGSAYFSERQGTETVLFSASLFGSPPTVRAIGRGLEVKAIAPAAADELGVLTDSGVFVVTPSTGQARLIYAGGPFIQGFLRLEGLLSEAGRYYVGDLCHPDADAPEWGTVELTPPSPLGALPVTPGSARWITGTPSWPWSTPIVDKSSSSWSPRLPVVRTPRGGFIVSQVSP